MKLARMTAIAAIAIATLSGCSQADKDQIRRLALPEAASDRSDYMFDLWVGTWIAVLVTFLLVFGLLMYAAVRYRRKSDDEIPPQLRYHLPLEALYTFAPVIVVAVFFFHTVTAQNDILRKVDNPDHTITVVGSKWQWAFNYIGETAVDNEDVFEAGQPDNLADLYLPIGESVRFNLKSPDVIHSFWIPEFYFKMDVVPGKVNSFDMTPTREGTFTGRCAELCGLYHSRMLFKVHVVTRAEYDAYLEKLKAEGNIGAPEGSDKANTIAGLEPENGEEG
ncbi:cytochrome c oxidase subunit II [soil metagenome]